MFLGLKKIKQSQLDLDFTFLYLRTGLFWIAFHCQVPTQIYTDSTIFNFRAF